MTPFTSRAGISSSLIIEGFQTQGWFGFVEGVGGHAAMKSRGRITALAQAVDLILHQ
jgi:hypothetical protein